ncbi:MAG: hypothetical protein KTR30_30280 [Saprospiraceae bacterium]|nr:hypothetical protein [Saprospiraceae bacterium]
MCKTLHYTLLTISLLFAVVDPMNAITLSFPKRLLTNTQLPARSAVATPTARKDRAMIPDLPNPPLLDSVKTFLETALTPFNLHPTPYLFIDELKKRAANSLIRNGDLDVLEKAYWDYQDKLAKIRVFTKTHKIPLQAKRKELCAAKNGHSCAWGALRKMRKQLLVSFEDFRLALQTAYHTEQLLWAQYHHNPDLYQAINTLVNLNGKSLPVYVQTRVSLFHEDPDLQHLEGMLVLSLQEGIFSSDTPIIRMEHPDFVGRAGAIAVFVEADADGATLSHEFGHLYYLYHHWEQYMKFIAHKGSCYEIGGHGTGDPSGIAANLAENGEMPDLHMPWTYRKQWLTIPHSLWSSADE